MRLNICFALVVDEVSWTVCVTVASAANFSGARGAGASFFGLPSKSVRNFDLVDECSEAVVVVVVDEVGPGSCVECVGCVGCAGCVVECVGCVVAAVEEEAVVLVMEFRAGGLFTTTSSSASKLEGFAALSLSSSKQLGEGSNTNASCSARKEGRA